MNDTRRLAAIMAVDVVGFSRLMGEDEAGAARAVREARDAVRPLIAGRGGRIVKTMGDGLLLEFPSVVAAVECAIAIQKLMLERNAATPEAKQIVYRIGVHLGDILVEGDDILGEGVNIAARLEGICEPGGVLISSSAHEHVRGRVDVGFVDLGERALKNIARPVRAYRVATTDLSVSARPGPGLVLPDKPSIAVLAFQNMSADPDQEYFADGIVDDIITGLSRIKWLFVIARNSSFIYKGKAIDVRQVGRELGVRYVLEGGVRKAGNRLRITTQLIEAETGAHLWADKYDGPLEDVFDLQDRITDQVVGIVEPSLQRSEIERSRRKRPENLDAYDLYLRALPFTASQMPADANIAAGFLLNALKLDPGYAAAHALLAWCREWLFMRGGFAEEDRASGLRHARAAIASATDDAATLGIAALVILLLDRDFEGAVSTVARALSLNASCATALYLGALIQALAGHSGEAIAHAQRALRLSPFDRLAYQAHLAMGIAATYEARYNDAVAHHTTNVQANPSLSTNHFCLATALALAGRLDEGKSAARRGLALEPGFRTRFFSQVWASSAEGDKLVAAGRLIGLPE